MSRKTINWMCHFGILAISFVLMMNMLSYIYGVCYTKEQELMEKKYTEWHQILQQETPDELKEIIDFIEKEND